MTEQAATTVPATPPFYLHELIAHNALRQPQAVAVVDAASGAALSYADLWQHCQGLAGLLQALAIRRGERVAIWLEKRPAAVVAPFAASLAGAVFVNINPLLKAAQLRHVLHDSGAAVLITSQARLAAVQAGLKNCPALRHIVLCDNTTPPATPAARIQPWPQPQQKHNDKAAHGRCDSDLAALFYTSGSTGQPRGVMLSQRNLVAGAHSVARYLQNRADDVLLAALPLSFDAGFSQLTTAFAVGARVVLLNYLLPRDIVLTCERHQVTGLTAVAPLWMQLAQLDWPPAACARLRYFANTGGHLPGAVVTRLQAALAPAEAVLMYGLTEGFRATWLPPAELERRPDSMGRAIPNVDILILRPDGTPCAAGEAGELVQRGPLVAQGYWQNEAASAKRFRPLPAPLRQGSGEEIALFSGDTVKMDADGYCYFVGRSDEMIKTSGYRVSPQEIETVLHECTAVAECAALGVADAALGQTIVLWVYPAADFRTQHEHVRSAIGQHCRQHLPAWMQPHSIHLCEHALPRNANGKIDRTALREATEQAAAKAPNASASWHK